MIYNFEELSDENYINFYDENVENYEKFQQEHQIGRFNSIKKILIQIKEEKTPGDILEFGCWQGHSLMNILNILEKNEMFDKKLVGIDGFVGIPTDYGHINCKDGLFDDTDKETCINNVNSYSGNFPNVKDNLYILQSFYKEFHNIKKFLDDLSIEKVSFIHLDCDVVKSCEESLVFLSTFAYLQDVFYLHFDDWGIETGIPEWFYDFLKTDYLKDYKCTELFNTRLTRSFKFEKK